MHRRSLISLILVNIVVTFLVALGTLTVWSSIAPTPTSKSVPIVVIVTATFDSAQMTLAASSLTTSTPYVVVVTATPSGGDASVPATGTAADTPSASGSQSQGAPQTLDPALLPSLPAVTDVTATETPQAASTDANGCQLYTVKKGDVAGAIASSFGVSLSDLMSANHLSEHDINFLQIGQTLVIPLNGCGVATDEPTETPTNFVVPTLPSTSTLAPTASQAKIEITRVISPGDLTSEGVEIHNISGGVIQMEGWKLSDSKGDAFTFPSYLMFNSGRVTVYTKTGTNTPIVLYWGQPRALWGDPNEVITLTDASGNVQATQQVGAVSIPTPAS